MKVQMKSLKFTADVSLLDFVQKRMDKLETFSDQIIDGEAYLRLVNDGEQNNKLVELKLNLPGATLFAKDRSTSFEAATDTAAEGLRRQLKKYKEKKVLSRRV